MVFKIWEQKNIQKSRHDKAFDTENMLPISEIKWDTIINKDGWLRAVLKVSGLNLDLKNFEEQEVILQQYKRFLNGLSFPVQLLIRSTYLDLSNYLSYMNRKVNKIENKALKQQWEGYIKFLQWIDLQQWLIYVKEFYIVIPYYLSEQDNKELKKPWRSKIMSVLNSKDSVENIVSRYRSFIKWGSQLQTRCSLIIEWLSWINIPVERLNTTQIISLLFRFYNPTLHSSQAEPDDDMLTV